MIKDLLEIDAGVWVKVFDISSYDFNEIEPKSGAPMLKPLGQRKMTEIYCRDGASILKEIDKFGFLMGFWQYSYQIPAHPMWFNRDEIMYCTENPRSMSCYGYARTQYILDLVKSLHYSTLYNKRFFEETPIPDGALSLLDTNEAEMKGFMNWWNTEFKAQPHKLALINKDIKWQPFNISQRELEFLETQKAYYNFVISMFGLTPSELGITDNVNRSTSATQSELVKRKGIRPFLKLIESYINVHIIPEFNYEGIEFQFIYDDPAEKAAKLNNWKLELDMGIKTINEVRKELGLEPIEGGDIPNNIANRPQQIGAQGLMNPSEMNADNSKEHQSGNYDDTLQREEGNNSKKTKNTDQEVKRNIKTPFSDSKKPTSGFKSVEITKSKFVELSLDDLITEHKKIVSILESGNDKDKKDLLEEQKKELEQYISERQLKKSSKLSDSDIKDLQRKVLLGLVDDVYRILIATGMNMSEAALYAQKLKYRARTKGISEVSLYPTDEEIDKFAISQMNVNFNGLTNAEQDEIILLWLRQRTPDVSKGVDDGQYYHEQKITQPSKPSGAMFQPQNNRNNIGGGFISDNDLISDNRKPGVDTYSQRDDIHCPLCFAPTLASINSLESMREDIRCTQCGARFKKDDLLNAKMLEEMSNVLTANNNVSPVSYSTKCCEHHNLNKSLDLDLDVKSYCGFDINKSVQFSRTYAQSAEYRKLMREYLNDINASNRAKILMVLKTGIESGKTMRDISIQIDQIIRDKPRSELIARTEIVRITNEGNREMMKSRGAKEVEWFSAPEDGRLCKICKELNGKRFKIDDAPNPSEIHVNCRCTFSEVSEYR